MIFSGKNVRYFLNNYCFESPLFFAITFINETRKGVTCFYKPIAY